MAWVAQKLDVFAAAVVVALAGAVTSQGQPFVVQYLQRTGAALADARDHLEDVRTGLRYRVMGDTVRQELEGEASGRVRFLESAYDGVLHANPLVRPLAILNHGDPVIVATTQERFVPALPTSRGAIVLTILGMIVGFVVYELVKLPVLALAREPRRRKFRKRG